MEQDIDKILIDYYKELSTLNNEYDLLSLKYELRINYVDNRRKRRIQVEKKIEKLLNNLNSDLTSVQDISTKELFNLLLTMDEQKFPIIKDILSRYNYLNKFNTYYSSLEYRLLKNMKMVGMDKNVLATKIIMNDENCDYPRIYNKIIETIILSEEKPLEFSDFKKMIVLYMERLMKIYTNKGKCFIKDIRPEKQLGASMESFIILYEEVVKDFYDNANLILIFTMFHELTHTQQYVRIIEKQELSMVNMMELKDRILSKAFIGYYTINYDNLTYENEAEYSGILNTLDFLKILKIDYKHKDKYLAKAEEKKNNFTNFKRRSENIVTTLSALFDVFIRDHPELLEKYPMLKHEYKIEKDKVFHKTNEEMQKYLEQLLTQDNITDEEKERYINFYSAFRTEKSRNS